jgi:arabinofuranosyltransferase
VPLLRDAGAPIVAPRLNVGILGYAAGPRVHVVDRLGLGDALGARMRVDRRGRPGHEKWLSDAWVVGRFADPAAPLPPGAPSAQIIGAARAALACPPLAELLRAIEAPLTPTVFIENVGVAWRLRKLEIASDPRQAAAELCKPR